MQESVLPASLNKQQGQAMRTFIEQKLVACDCGEVFFIDKDKEVSMCSKCYEEDKELRKEMFFEAYQGFPCDW